MKTFSLLFIFLLKNVCCFFKRKQINVNKLYYSDDDWAHGEVEWDFPEKYIIYDKLKYTSLIEQPIVEKKMGVKLIEENSKKEDLHSNAIYYGMMKTINEEAVNFQEILLNIQNICFVKSDTNEDVSKDFYILILIFTLKANYELSKSRENELLNKLQYKKKYLKIKRIVSSIMLILFTILCRNVNGVE
jgi:hypothetical protein